MAMIVEVNTTTNGKVLVNLDLIEKIIPSVNGNGCVLHFGNSYLAVKESIKDFGQFALQIIETPMIEERIKKIKKEALV